MQVAYPQEMEKIESPRRRRRRLRLDVLLQEAGGVAQAGLIIAADIGGSFAVTPLAMPISITWEGYEFLNASRDSGLWQKAKEKVIGPAAGVSFTLLLEWLKEEGKRRLRIP